MDHQILKIEIIIQNIYLDKLLDFLEAKGVLGFSAFEIGRGKGASEGEHMVEGLLPTTRWTYLFSLLTDEAYQKMKAEVCTFLGRYRGSLIVTKVYDTCHIVIS